MEILKFTEGSLLFQCIKSSQQLKKRLDNLMEELELTFNQALILIVIKSENKNKVSPSIIVDALTLPKSIVSQQLSILEEEKLLMRKVDLEDARKYVLSLTKKGKAKAQQSIKIIDSLDKELEEPFSKQEVSKLLFLHKRISLLHS